MTQKNDKFEPCPHCGRKPWITEKIRRRFAAYCGHDDCRYAGAVDAPDIDSLRLAWNMNCQKNRSIGHCDG